MGSSTTPPSAPAPSWAFRVAVIAAISISLGVGAYFYIKIRRASQLLSALDQPLGVKRVPGVEESGFYNTEGGQSADPFRWTNGSARLIVPFDGPPPVALHVRLGLAVPKPTKVAIQVNGTPLFSETVKPQTEWVRTFDLSGLVATSPITIEILSDTFIPSRRKKQGKDDRALGVCVRGVTLLSAARDYAGMNLAAEPVPGVEESGFHSRERCGGQPCRWTNGNAKVTVPITSDRPWRTLVVMAEIPDRPNYRVRLVLNDQILFDDVARSGTIWAKEFPLDGINLGRQAVIELTSSTITPGQSKSGDKRTLGIRLRKLMLLGG
jgi:hypothetical protein